MFFYHNKKYICNILNIAIRSKVNRCSTSEFGDVTRSMVRYENVNPSYLKKNFFNESLVSKIGVDAAENEPRKFLGNRGSEQVLRTSSGLTHELVVNDTVCIVYS
jgi:hypothetical protein